MNVAIDWRCDVTMVCRYMCRVWDLAMFSKGMRAGIGGGPFSVGDCPETLRLTPGAKENRYWLADPEEMARSVGASKR